METFNNVLANIQESQNTLKNDQIFWALYIKEDFLKCLEKVEEHWRKSSPFFNNIKVIMNNDLSENIKTFIENSKV